MKMSRYEPEPRFNHCCVAIGKLCYLYGGCCIHEPPSFVEVFDQKMKTWTKHTLTFEGTVSYSIRRRGACCSLPSGDIYFYGGYCDNLLSNQLFKLITKSLEFIKLTPGGENRPSEQGGCRMVAFHRTKLALYGGQVYQSTRYTISNDFHVYDTLTGDWSVPVMRGIAPPPNSYFTFTAIDDHRALVFGGHVNEQRTNSRTDDLYLIDFNKMEMIKLERNKGQPWPAARGSHAACCLGFGSKHPQLLIMGGLDSQFVTIEDAWIYDINSHTWRELKIPEFETVLKRVDHSMTAVTINPVLVEVTIFGGCRQFNPTTYDDNQLALAETTVLKFELRPGGQWILLPLAGTINETYSEVQFLNTVCNMIESKMKSDVVLYKNDIEEIERGTLSTWAKMPLNEKKEAITKFSSQPLEDHCLLTPIEYRALHAVFSAYNNKEIMETWQSLYHLRIVTFHIVMLSLRSEIVEMDFKDKFVKVLQKLKAKEAYELALCGETQLKMTYLKFIAFGLPRSGKSSMFRRLIGEIMNLQQLGGVSRSTGVAECRDVIIKPFNSVPAAILGSDETSSIWESLKKTPGGADEKFVLGDREVDHTYLAHLFFHIISKISTENVSDDDPVETRAADEGALLPTTGLPLAPLIVIRDTVFLLNSLTTPSEQPDSNNIIIPPAYNVPTASELKAVEAAIEELSSILDSDSPEEFQILLEKLIMINMMDVGGQPGFVEMLPAFTTGSALYFLFFRMDQEIRKLYPVRFLAMNSVKEVVLESLYCIEDVLCQLVSSISCFESFKGSVEISSELKSRALLFGTFKDQIKGPDLLESRCKEIEATLWKTLSSMQEDLLLEADEKHKFFMIDNMEGNDDIDSIRTTIEDIIRSSFSQTEVPPSWLMFRILLILVGKPVVSLNLCQALATRLEMPTPVKDAIQFFHHNIGSLMYYPEVESVKDLVICDPQVIFDSISELVIDTFGVANRAIPRSVRKEFESKGFFTLKHIESTTEKKRKSHLTPRQLIDLLKHLGILAEIQVEEQPSSQEESTKFIIPAVLNNASEDELSPDSSYEHSYSIMVHFDCGFVPYGVFCFVVARLISSQDALVLPWKLRKDLPIRKNRVVFLVDGRFDIVLVSRPKRLEIQLGQPSNSRKKAMTIADVCPVVRAQIVKTLNDVIKEMKYKLSISSELETQPFSMAFPCSMKGHTNHLMKIIEEKGQTRYAQCLKDEREMDLSDYNQLLWFGKEEVPHDVDAHVTTVGELTNTANYSGILNINHLDQVQVAIWEGRTEWRYLGLELRLSPETLKSIHRNHPQSVNDCFREMLSEWLMSSQRPSWESLISALRSPTVGLQSLASNLEIDKESCENSSSAESDDVILRDLGILNINHLIHVVHTVWEGRTEWRNLGLELGLSSDTLEAIGMDYHQSVKECFLEMFSEWLRNDHRPSWEALLSALRSPSVGLETLAVKLDKNTMFL